ncbi:hypothetical protein [Conexibacter sp. CPCC 206217]|uniref:hypothetical protein n=1 Tax=Conexibacter sp. CPCC 206217 TaxID=3064574 RepID=UPI002719BD00|nr:hypothetical protein [Conexibacter sp. CPCC 206217]MDO8209684.1 hypothetical protein [Conexibacter sp. CPCC 206217]
MRRRLRRAAAFTLVPLSALPLLAVAPLVVPAAQHRVNELFGSAPAHHSVPQTPEGKR